MSVEACEQKRMSMLVHPLHYLLVERHENTWKFMGGSFVFYNPRNVPVSLAVADRLHRFRLTPETVMIELFRIHGGRAGYYLVNLRDRNSYYCGQAWESIITTPQSLGIGRSEA